MHIHLCAAILDCSVRWVLSPSAVIALRANLILFMSLFKYGCPLLCSIDKRAYSASVHDSKLTTVREHFTENKVIETA